METTKPTFFTRNRRSSCGKCRKSHSHAPGKFVPFYELKQDGKHIRKDSPILCESCAIDALLSPSTDIVGVLSPDFADHYLGQCDNQHWKELRSDGFTIIRNKELSATMRRLVEGGIYPTNLRRKGAAASLRSKKRGHRLRGWAHIYPSGNTRNTRDDCSIANQLKEVQTTLSRILFTHEYYGLFAHNRGEELMRGCTEMSSRKEELGKFTEILKIADINVLVKGPGLEQAQDLHVDGCGLKVILIYVDRCNNDNGNGYKFRYIGGSHRLLEEHKHLHEKCRLPGKLTSEKVLKTGDCIVLFESTIHGGGASSSNREICGAVAQQDMERYQQLGLERFRWFGRGKYSHLLPVDLSIQLTFHFYSCPSASSVPNRTNIWYEKTDALEFEDECCGLCNEKLSSAYFEFGKCEHVIHKHCLLDVEHCPLCRGKRKWIKDNSAIDFEDQLKQLKDDQNIESILEKSYTGFFEKLRRSKRIVPKRKFGDV